MILPLTLIYLFTAKVALVLTLAEGSSRGLAWSWPRVSGVLLALAWPLLLVMVMRTRKPEVPYLRLIVSR